MTLLADLIRLWDRLHGRIACRVCGCTDNAACRGGCSWVEIDLCSACAFAVDGETLDAFRAALLTMMSDWSESYWAAGWMSGLEEMLHDRGGRWEIMGRAVGWPNGYEDGPGFAWMTWDAAGALFSDRKAARGGRLSWRSS